VLDQQQVAELGHAVAGIDDLAAVAAFTGVPLAVSMSMPSLFWPPALP